MPTSEKHQLPSVARINEKTVHSRIISEGIPFPRAIGKRDREPEWELAMELLQNFHMGYERNCILFSVQ